MMGKKRAKAKKPRTKTPAPKRLELGLEELKAIIERTESGPLSAEDREKLAGAVDTLAYVTQELDSKGVSIKRLRKLIFGVSTEKTSQVVGDTGGEASASDDADGDRTGAKDAEAKPKPKPKRKGHGRNGASAYTGADKVKVPHETLKPGDPCPACPAGTLYLLSEPAVLVRVTGMAPLGAVVYEKDRLRCNPCGAVFVASSPDGVGTAKYDETAAAMIGLAQVRHRDALQPAGAAAARLWHPAALFDAVGCRQSGGRRHGSRLRGGHPTGRPGGPAAQR